jgi:hypothetical protein
MTARRRPGFSSAGEGIESMADQLYLSYWIRNFGEQNMLRHYEKLLRLFPYSKLAPHPSTFKVIAVAFDEPALLETAFPPPVDVDRVLGAAKEFAHDDSCYRLETWWDLWQHEEDWQLAPARVTLCCFGPRFEHEDHGNLCIEFGIDTHFLPRTELPQSLRMVQSNIQSLLKLVHDADDALPVEIRKLWTESGDNFSERLHQALSLALE